MNRPLRFAFLSHLDLNLYLFRLPIMRALIKQGHEVYALSPRGAFSDRFAQEGVRYVPYHVDRSNLNPFKETFSIVSLSQTLRRIKPDLLHSFTMKPNIHGALASELGGCKKRVASVTGLGSFYTRNAKSLSQRLFRCGLDKLYASAMRHVDRVIFYNSDDLNECVRMSLCKPEQCIVIPGSGVDTHRFMPTEKSTSRPVIITMVARLIRDKGIKEFLIAAERLKTQWGNGVIFQLAGDTDPGNLWAADSAQLAESSRRGIVRLLGFVEDVPALLRTTDIYTLPSHREGRPVSVLEAMSCGLPVVTTDAPGCRDTIVHNESGLLVPVKDAISLTEALDQLIRDSDLRHRFGQQARRRAEEIFSSERIVGAHLDIYKSLLDF